MFVPEGVTKFLFKEYDFFQRQFADINSIFVCGRKMDGSEDKEIKKKVNRAFYEVCIFYSKRAGFDPDECHYIAHKCVVDIAYKSVVGYLFV
jgi:hypothetical protein